MHPYELQIDPFEPIYPIDAQVNLIKPKVYQFEPKITHSGPYWTHLSPQIDPF